MNKVLLLGASGSIGSQSLDLLDQGRVNFELVGFSVGHKVEKINEILNKFKTVKYICVQEEKDYVFFKNKFPNITFFYGDEGLKNITLQFKNEMVINALVGFSGLVPSVVALEQNNVLCLANKESLVVGGSVIRSILKDGKGKLFPIDSEHVSIAKMLNKVGKENVKKILITASGGAFRNKTISELEHVTAADALKHPTWVMGPKITIDCATMMNKGFEVIEANWLYDFPLKDTEILMHDESYVHSVLLLNDGSYVADISKPDMHNPIKWSIYQGAVDYEIARVDSLEDLKEFHFHQFDPKKYPCVEIALNAFKRGGNAPAILNAANEELVYSFLRDEIKFRDIETGVLNALNVIPYIETPSLNDLIETDKRTREYINSNKEVL